MLESAPLGEGVAWLGDSVAAAVELAAVAASGAVLAQEAAMAGTTSNAPRRRTNRLPERVECMMC
jgi:hypothetical protein